MNEDQPLSTIETSDGVARFVTTRWSVVRRLWDPLSGQPVRGGGNMAQYGR
ncbi:MAG: hypothetical protein GYA76_05070, partial [Verrucomicrobia bacterium]|nr:hypothetical protein [Verrucomicrobiota bacterium]